MSTKVELEARIKELEGHNKALVKELNKNEKLGRARERALIGQLYDAIVLDGSWEDVKDDEYYDNVTPEDMVELVTNVIDGARIELDRFHLVYRRPLYGSTGIIIEYWYDEQAQSNPVTEDDTQLWMRVG